MQTMTVTVTVIRLCGSVSVNSQQIRMGVDAAMQKAVVEESAAESFAVLCATISIC